MVVLRRLRQSGWIAEPTTESGLFDLLDPTGKRVLTRQPLAEVLAAWENSPAARKAASRRRQLDETFQLWAGLLAEARGEY